MSISSRIREQIISTFRAEVAEHIQTITDGLLVLEKHQQPPEERQATLQGVFRAAHSMKGAARAVGVTAVEQLGHGLENILSDMQKNLIKPNASLYTVCYQALDAIQAVEAAYEDGETTPPIQALQSLTDLERLHTAAKLQASVDMPEPATPGVQVSPFTAANGEGENADSQVSFPDVSIQAVSADATSPNHTPPWMDETIRVQVEKLDAVIAQLSELLMAKIRLDQRGAQISQLKGMSADLQKEWLTARDQFTQARYLRKGSLPYLPEQGKDASSQRSAIFPSQTLIKDISNRLNDLSRDYANDTVQLSTIIDALEQEVIQIRLLPLNTITGTFERMVRNLATESNKKVDFEISGEVVEMDKRVLELVKDPLIHMLRNAIDHGIETPIEREHLGKPSIGKVTLSAEHLGKDVVLRVSDDGSGLNMNAIRQAVAHQTGLNSQEMTDGELISWIFSPGITTSPIVTDVSGRGIGLDIVRRNVEALQGRVDVNTLPGGGTTFALTIPMELTSSHVLLIQVVGQNFALPISSIERIIAIRPAEISSIGGQEVLRYNGSLIPLVQLKVVLGLPDLQEPAADTAQHFAIILAAAERRMAFVVDKLLSEQEIVIKGLGNQLTRVGGISGATVLGSGKVVLVLNVVDLIKLASRSENRATPAVHPAVASQNKRVVRKRILVADDSITTRTLEKHILEAQGFVVQVATDGQEALSIIATSGLPDLVITDLAMPRIDGFELTSRLKSDPRTHVVPVILVTSLDSPEDKAHGVQVGADAYIVKRSFDQANLLEMIQQLIG